MKYKVFIIIALTILLILTNTVSAITKLPLHNKQIYIDPGHGGADPGAIYKDIYEKDINLNIAKTLKVELEKKGADVYLTREDDYDLSEPRIRERKRSDFNERIRMIDNNADMFISIHLNSYPSSKWCGPQVFYHKKNKNNKDIAEAITKSLKEDIFSTRKIKTIKDLYMFDNIKTRGVLIEVGFLTNPNDRYLLRQETYVTKITSSIVKGIVNYYK